jgi:hypothetical protein
MVVYSFTESIMKTNSLPGFSSNVNPFIRATVEFSNGKCMIMINEISAKVRFYIEGRNIFAGPGLCLVFPGLDDRTRASLFDKILEIHSQEPENVFIVEFGQLGPIAEHPLN